MAGFQKRKNKFLQGIFMEGCHPGVPPYDDFEAQVTTTSRSSIARSILERPAALAVRKTKENTNQPGITMVGSIVERSQTPDSIRPPGNLIIKTSLPTSPPKLPPISKKSPAQQPHKSETIEMEEISRENEERISLLTTREILEEQEELRKVLPVKLYERWCKPPRG